MLLTGLLSLAYSHCFLTLPRATYPGMALSTVGCRHPLQSSYSSAEVPSTQVTLVCVEMTKLTNTIHMLYDMSSQGKVILFPRN